MSGPSQTFTFDWQGISLSVTYTPEYWGPGIQHMAFHVGKGVILPITHTGYKSHFFHDHVESYGGPEGYARAILDEAAQSPDWQHHLEAAQQLKLF